MKNPFYISDKKPAKCKVYRVKSIRFMMCVSIYASLIAFFIYYILIIFEHFNPSVAGCTKRDFYFKFLTTHQFPRFYPSKP
jgi:hypothetical protein